MTTEEKQAELDRIAAEIRQFKGLDIAQKATKAVPGEGNPDSWLMFIGEAPGFNEDLQGRPFVGQAGKLLEKVLKEKLSLDRREVYITNIVKFRPPNNRDPEPNEIEACRGWLDQQIEIISPKIIVTLGRYSMGKFVADASISRIHGQSRFISFQNRQYIMFPMYHPAAALRAGTIMKLFEEDFEKLKNLLETQKEKTVEKSEKNEGSAQTSLF